MKRNHTIILSAVVFYAVTMVVCWKATSSLANKKTLRALHESRSTFANVSADAVDTVLWYSSHLIFDEIGDTPKAYTIEQMKGLSVRHHLDELNIVNSNGLVIASNLPECLGYDFSSKAASKEFLKLLRPDQPSNCFGQPYRQSMCCTNQYYKYYGVAFRDRSGFIQLGFSLDRVMQAYGKTPARDYEHWHVGLYGHFEAVDDNHDGFADRVSSLPEGFPEEGIVDEGYDEQLGRVFRYEFPYAGLLFRAVIPEREFHEQRNRFIVIAGVSLAIMLAIFAFFLIRLATSSERLNALLRSTEARNAADLAVARVIQMSSLPRAELFRISNLESAFDAVTYPAREVGGDFYSMFELSDRRVVFVVADVSGKGVPAAMFMHIAVNAIQTGFRAVNAAEEAVAAVNNYLCDHNEAEMFVTAWVGVLNPSTGDVEYVNAGHNRPYVIRKNGSVERIDGRGGLILGMFPKRSYRSGHLQLNPGDRLFLYTDGVTEAMNIDGQVYGEDRLVRLLEKDSIGGGLCKMVKADVDAYIEGCEHSDDMTMLELSWHGVVPRVERVFAAKEDSLGEAIAFLRAETKLQNPKQAARLFNAVDEMLSNVVNYSGGGEFSIAVENIPGRCRVIISDSGVEYNPLTHNDPNIHTPLAQREVGGLGILMAKKLVNSIEYQRDGGKNILTLVQVDFSAVYRQHG